MLWRYYFYRRNRGLGL